MTSDRNGLSILNTLQVTKPIYSHIAHSKEYFRPFSFVLRCSTTLFVNFGRILKIRPMGQRKVDNHPLQRHHFFQPSEKISPLAQSRKSACRSRH
jgi:hypothetical protein